MMLVLRPPRHACSSTSQANTQTGGPAGSLPGGVNNSFGQLRQKERNKLKAVVAKSVGVGTRFAKKHWPEPRKGLSVDKSLNVVAILWVPSVAGMSASTTFCRPILARLPGPPHTVTWSMKLNGTKKAVHDKFKTHIGISYRHFTRLMRGRQLRRFQKRSPEMASVMIAVNGIPKTVISCPHVC